MQQQIIYNLNNVRKFNINKSTDKRFKRMSTTYKQQLPDVLPLIISIRPDTTHVVVPVHRPVCVYTSINSAAFRNPVRTPVQALHVTYPYNIINSIQLVDMSFFNWRQGDHIEPDTVCIWCCFKCSNYICALRFTISFDKHLHIDTFYLVYTIIHIIDPNFGYRNKNTMEIIDNDTWN